MPDKKFEFPIIDSHIHLFPKSEFDSISWMNDGHPLNRQYSVEDFKSATASGPLVSGFVVIENDRKFDLHNGEAGWEAPLQEVEWYRRLALGEPRAGEGHSTDDSRLAVGLVPWAPLPSGVEAIEKYLDKAKQVVGPAWPKVKGFRYLLQDKAPGTALEHNFIESLKLLGRRGFVFELCIDYHHKGRSQLDDTVALISRAHKDVFPAEQVVVVLNHMLKPDLTAPFCESDSSFQAWATAVAALGKFPHTYMKLSGALSEMSEQTKSLEPSAVADFLLPWFRAIIVAFGLDRIIFASDWPVCTIGVGDSWTHWRRTVESMCIKLGLDNEHIEAIFAKTASKVYRV